MKRGTKICVGCNILCAVCVLLVVAAVVGTFILFVQHHSKEKVICTRHEAIVAERCVQLDSELGASIAEINATDTILLPPSNYSKIHGLCEQVEECARQIHCKEIRRAFFEMTVCSFVHFYVTEFAECANKLIAKKDDVQCLGELFNPKEKTIDEMCVSWRKVTPCVKAAIRENCNDRLGILQMRYENQARKGDAVFCEDQVASAPLH
ncbi:unnamed protein product [Caenorhabditis bovis]|uniref:T20D4.11-like domain-containing protein n=1 Tax=Caenorhabditis bovis TaxID=2654633 RepID=A0A8S1ECQ1_9PELO|nr:unnamed protein product [Caenorhabditis bovis]